MPDKDSKRTDGDALFDDFVAAKTFKVIYSSFLTLCEYLEIKPFVNHQNFYNTLKSKVTSWKAKSLWTKLDKRFNRKEYMRGRACLHTNVLVIGAGPCGLRTAIELAMLGAKVVIVEKRSSFSRNNVLHLWPFLITDLRNLGAKKFFGKFCAGAIDHISIRQLQVILLKVSLLLGVEIHYDVTFEELEEPPEDQEGPEKIGWRARLKPRDHPVSEFEFDVIIGADGRRNTLPGFDRKEFRGKLAIAVTANFINRHTQADARVEEISGVAFIFNQQFFQNLKAETGIDLENIVYYKDETHYFVMTAKKQSLLQKGVILEDLPDTAKLLAHENVNQDKLQIYAREAADFSTNRQLPTLDFALNHYGLPDIAMFDFTSIFAAKHAACVRDRNGHKLLLALVGDSLLEPFWPTGSGCARGFLGAFDAAWMVRCWASGQSTPLQCLAEREAVYRLLAQTTPENLHKDYDAYGINPNSRYPVLNLKGVPATEVLHLYDTKDEDLKKQFEILERKVTPKFQRTGSVMKSGKLLLWCQRVTESYKDVNVENMTSSWRNGLAMCAIIHRYRPHLIDFDALKAKDMIENNQLAFEIAEQQLGIPPAMSAKDMASFEGPDKLAMVAYISRFYDLFKDEVPEASIVPNNSISEDLQLSRSAGPPKGSFLSRFTKRMKKSGRKSHHEADRIPEENEKNVRGPPLSPVALKRKSQQDKDADFYRKRQILMEGSQPKKDDIDKERPDVGIRGQNKVSGLAEQLAAQFRTIAGITDMDGQLTVGKRQNGSVGPGSNRSSSCFFCGKHVYVMERLSAESLFFHRDCFRCQHCDIHLKIGTYCFAPDEGQSEKGKFYCRLHFSETQRQKEELERQKAEEERRKEEEEKRIAEERKSFLTIPEDPSLPTSPSPRSPPPVSPPGEDRLGVPMNKRYKATPERIVLQNMYDEIHRLTEEEQASYNLGGAEDEDGSEYDDESSDSDDSQEENEFLSDEEMGSDEEEVSVTSDEDETEEEEDEEEESEEEEAEESLESRQLASHNERISRITNQKWQWLNDTSPQQIQTNVKPLTQKVEEEQPEKQGLRKISVDSNFGLSTLERTIKKEREAENKGWRLKMAQTYASFEDDLPYMKRITSQEEMNLKKEEEDNLIEDERNSGKEEEDQVVREASSSEESCEDIEEYVEDEPQLFYLREKEGKIDKDGRERTDSKFSNSSFTISTPSSSVSDVPTSPRSSEYHDAMSDGRDSSASPIKRLSLPRVHGEGALLDIPPTVSLEPDDGGKGNESSTDNFKEEIGAPQPPQPSPRVHSPQPSPRRKLPQPPTGGVVPPQPAPRAGNETSIPKLEEATEDSTEKKPYESVYSRKNRGVRSPMLASNTSNSFNKIPGMDEMTITPSNENKNNAGTEPVTTKIKVRPDSPIEYLAPVHAIQPHSVRADTLSLQKDREVRSHRIRMSNLKEKTSRSSQRKLSGKDPETTKETQSNFEQDEEVRDIENVPSKPSVYLTPQTESSTDPVFHDVSTNLSEGALSPDGSEAWHSASSEVPTFQFENGIPKSESRSKEKKSRISLIRRDKKHRKGVRKSRDSAVVGEQTTPTTGDIPEKKKSSSKKRKSSKSKSRSAKYIVSEDNEDDFVIAETTPDDEREKRRQKVPDIEGLIKGSAEGPEKQLPRLIRKLTVDPELSATFDVDESSSEDEEEEEDEEYQVEEEVKLRKGKGRRMWGKKFKVPLKRGSKRFGSIKTFKRCLAKLLENAV